MEMSKPKKVGGEGLVEILPIFSIWCVTWTGFQIIIQRGIELSGNIPTTRAWECPGTCSN
jgi:hypothetical protein